MGTSCVVGQRENDDEDDSNCDETRRDGTRRTPAIDWHTGDHAHRVSAAASNSPFRWSPPPQPTPPPPPPLKPIVHLLLHYTAPYPYPAVKGPRIAAAAAAAAAVGKSKIAQNLCPRRCVRCTLYTFTCVARVPFGHVPGRLCACVYM